MKILVVDLETTGLDPKLDHITEIGFAAYDTTAKRIIGAAARLTKLPVDVVIPPEIVAMTGISKEMNSAYGCDIRVALTFLAAGVRAVDFVVAHNAHGMERPWLKWHFEQNEIELPPIKWVDSSVDVPYHPWIHTRKLTHLAADHSIPLRGAHGALEDCLTLIEILKHYDFDEVARVSQLPSFQLIAVGLPIARKDEAKSRGFRFNGDRREWSKVVKSDQVEREIAACPFKVLSLPAVLDE